MKNIFYTCILLVLVTLSVLGQSNVTVVKAKAGETVAKLAERYGADPAEVAKYNGLIPNSVLAAGREIKIPSKINQITYSRPATQNENPPCYSDQELDLARQKLPPNYHGNDIKEISWKLEARNALVKDEFETTPQFIERQKKEQSKSLIGNLTTTSPFALEVGGNFKYDADREEMLATYDFSTSVNQKYPLCDSKDYLPVADDIRALDFGGSSHIKTGEKVWSSTFPIKLDVARKLKPNLRLLASVSLTDRNGGYITATPSFLYKPLLNLDLRELWIYDGSSGTIIQKQSIKFDEVISLEARNADLIAKADGLYKSGNDDESLVLLRKILRSGAMNAKSYLLLGKIHLRRGNVDQAITSFETAEILGNFKLIEATISLGKIYLERVDCLQAKNYAASALYIDPKNDDAIALQRLSERCSR